MNPAAVLSNSLLGRPDEPDWAAEFGRRLPLKHLFVFHGNVRDLAWLESPDTPGEGGYHSLPNWLLEVLPTHGYEVVGVYDLVDGLRFGVNREEADGRAQKFQSVAGPEAKALAPPEEMLRSLRRVLDQDKTACAFVIDSAALLSQRPDELTDSERQIFLQIMKCGFGAAVVRTPQGRRNNLLILLTPRLNDLPPWLVIENPMLQTINIPLPDETERGRFFTARANLLFRYGQADIHPTVSTPVLAQLAHVTHGLTLHELECMVDLSRKEAIPNRDPQTLVHRFKFGVTHNPWEQISEKLRNVEAHLSRDVIGQPAAVHAVSDILKRAAIGLSGILHSSASSKPRGILFFAGPTGVGKTEMAKSLARLLFGDEAACIRFDMSEYSNPSSDQRLFGAPPGYVGYEAGGQLTSQVKKNPFSVLLFDEIEKADPSILDKFLQILEDGRLTSGQGETVFFSECLLIFTSNKGMYREVPDGAGGERKELRVPENATYEQVREAVMKGLDEFFKDELGRPEIRNRIGNNFVVFDFIREDAVERILDARIDRIAKVLEQRNERWTFDFSAVKPDLLRLVCTDLREYGGRGIANHLETLLVNPLARKLFDEPPNENGHIVIERINRVERSGWLDHEIEWSVENR